jgi:hypothetical protein
MSEPFTRTLVFSSYDLGKNAVLVLTFDSEIPGIYKDVFPTVYKCGYSSFFSQRI